MEQKLHCHFSGSAGMEGTQRERRGRRMEMALTKEHFLFTLSE